MHSLKPKQSISLLLEDVGSLSEPRISITLDGQSESQSESRGSSGKQEECPSCGPMRHMLCLRDRTIMQLAEDRDAIKIKLTKAMNLNVELSRQLIKYTNGKGQSAAVCPANAYSDRVRQEVADLKRKCSELEDMNHHLKQHLYTLKNVFVELGRQVSSEYFELASSSSECHSEPNPANETARQEGHCSETPDNQQTSPALSDFDIWYNN